MTTAADLFAMSVNDPTTAAANQATRRAADAFSEFSSGMGVASGAQMIGSAVNGVLNMAGSLATAATNSRIQKAYYATQELIADRKRDMALGAMNMEITKMDKVADMQAIRNDSVLELRKAQAGKEVVKAELAEQKATAKAAKIERREHFYGNAF